MAFAPSPSAFIGRRVPSLRTRAAPLHQKRTQPAPNHSRNPQRRAWLASAAASDVRVGFIGLGIMGLPMLANLSKTYKDLCVYNRTDKSELLADVTDSNGAKIEVCETPADVVRACDVTFSMLSTPEAVQSVFHEGPGAAILGASPGKQIVDCSTLQIQDMERTSKAMHERGALFLEAPVSGSKGPAEQGSLLFLCAGDEQVYQNPVATVAFDLMGRKAFFLGTLGNGTKMKLIVNQLMGTMLAALAEGITLTESVGLSVPDLLEVISLGAMANPMFSLKGPKMQNGAKGYEATNFPLEHAQKDMRFAQLLADEQGISMGVSSAANEWYKAAKGLGLSRADFAAVIESVRASSGRA